MGVVVTEGLHQEYRLDDLPERIRLKIIVNPVTGCWEWQGWRDKRWGYGYAWWEGKDRLVHRVVYALLVEPIPDDLTIDHVRDCGCRSKACCWPAHLEPVPSAENTARFYRAITICDRGHERTPENTYITPVTGQRACWPCKRIRNRRSWKA